MKWLLLVHQIHTSNSRERVKVWRALKKIGAALYRNSVYVLPYSKERLEDFQWACQQINDSKGEASFFISNTGSPQEERELENLFRKARAEDYKALLARATALKTSIHSTKERSVFQKEARMLQEEFEDIRKIDFFPNAMQNKAHRALEQISRKLMPRKGGSTKMATKHYSPKEFQNKVWTTRENIHIDRVASAWLIRKFIDPKAKFIFAPENSLPKDAIPFDVLGAEFGHHEDHCTFEVLTKAFQIRDAAVKQIAEIVHDVDLKDHKFGRTEATGINIVIRSLSDSTKDDQKVLTIGSSIFDGLYEHFSK